RALGDLGVPADVVGQLADLADAQLSSPDDPDPVAVQEVLLQRLRAVVGDGPLAIAAQAFADANPEPPGLFDLGDVQDEAARAAGYTCLEGARR
ncbi:MAG: hypothetical protein QOD63_2861, partial [Actinomycetota bacterium]|nr:hypothetical protein [Actinomycetota bacterium]